MSCPPNCSRLLSVRGSVLLAISLHQYGNSSTAAKRSTSQAIKVANPCAHPFSNASRPTASRGNQNKVTAIALGIQPRLHDRTPSNLSLFVSVMACFCFYGSFKVSQPCRTLQNSQSNLPIATERFGGEIKEVGRQFKRLYSRSFLR